MRGLTAIIGGCVVAVGTQVSPSAFRSRDLGPGLFLVGVEMTNRERQVLREIKAWLHTLYLLRRISEQAKVESIKSGK